MHSLPSFKNRKGRGACDAVPDTAYWCAALPAPARAPAHAPDCRRHYSLQLSLYACMLLDTQKVDVGDRMFIVNMHPDLERACEARAADLRPMARALMAVEEAKQSSLKRPRACEGSES